MNVCLCTNTTSSAEVCIECFAMPISWHSRRENILVFSNFIYWMCEPTTDNNATRNPLSIMYELNSFPDEYEIYSDAKHNIKISFDSIESESESEFLCLRQ